MFVINDLVKKLDKKVIEGKVIHCKAHVPSTPPRLKESEIENDINDDNGDKKQLEPGTIPGLSSPPMSNTQSRDVSKSA